MPSFFYKKEQVIDFAQIEDVDMIQELILHHCTVSNFSRIAQAKGLKSVALVNCNITSQDLVCLQSLEKLKKVTLGLMKLDSILCLTGIAPLRELTLRGTEGIDYAQLAQFPKLLSLSLLETEVPSFDFMKGLKNLKTLEIKDVPLHHLEFLRVLPKLKEFELLDRVEDESALESIGSMKQLQRFQYPVGDLRLYAPCPKLNSIGIDSSRVTDFTPLEGKTGITDIMFYNLVSKSQFEEQLASVSQYLTLESYGYTGEID